MSYEQIRTSFCTSFTDKSSTQSTKAADADTSRGCHASALASRYRIFGQDTLNGKQV